MSGKYVLQFSFLYLVWCYFHSSLEICRFVPNTLPVPFFRVVEGSSGETKKCNIIFFFISIKYLLDFLFYPFPVCIILKYIFKLVKIR